MKNFKESKIEVNGKGNNEIRKCKKEGTKIRNKQEERGNKGRVKDETVSYTHSECRTCTPGSLQLSV